MTNRLYYDQTYLREFDAQVLEIKKDGENFLARLDASAFYPTSGGQPFDTGKLGGKNVLDVFVDGEGEVWHKIDGEIAVGETVHGEIDWARRFDHMQQHAGEHMLANAVYRLLGGNTIGLHLGRDFSTIDVTLPDGKTRVDRAVLDALENDVNEKIWRNVPVKCWFPDEEELAQLPLRKPPTVKEHVRIVQIGELEYVACGGTHPASAGEIGLIRVMDCMPSKGKMRLMFVCGARAFELLRSHDETVRAAAGIFSSGVEQLCDRINETREQLWEVKRQLTAVKREKALKQARALCENAVQVRSLHAAVGQADADVDILREMAQDITAKEGFIALLAGSADENGLCPVVFAAAKNAPVQMGKLLSSLAKKYGGAGGGRDDFAQGRAGNAILQAALENLEGFMKA